MNKAQRETSLWSILYSENVFCLWYINCSDCNCRVELKSSEGEALRLGWGEQFALLPYFLALFMGLECFDLEEGTTQQGRNLFVSVSTQGDRDQVFAVDWILLSCWGEQGMDTVL